jgi:hypothetical protein
MNKVVVGLAPPPNTISVKPKVDSRNKNMIDKQGEGNVKIHNQKLNFNKVKARVDIRKKTHMLDGANEKVSGKVTCGMVQEQVRNMPGAGYKLCLLPSSCWFLACLILGQSRLMRYVSLKRLLTLDRLHAVIFQKIVLFKTLV